MSNPDKIYIAEIVASIIEAVINDAGIKMLLGGSIAIDENFKPTFRNGRVICSHPFIAVAVISDLDNSEILKLSLESGLEDIELISPFVDMLAYDVINAFEQQSDSFRALR